MEHFGREQPVFCPFHDVGRPDCEYTCHLEGGPQHIASLYRLVILHATDAQDHDSALLYSSSRIWGFLLGLELAASFENGSIRLLGVLSVDLWIKIT